MSITQPDNIVTQAARTAVGLITSITQGNFTRTYTYNANHYLVSEVDPEIGTIAYGRDALGNMTSKTIGSLPLVGYSYDKDNHLITTAYNNAAGAQTITRAYDADGHLKTVSNSSNKSTWSYSYDANDNLLNQTLTIGSATFAFGYTYDALDHLTSLTFPDATKVTYTVDALGHVTAIAPYVSAASYFPDGNVKSFTDGNGVVTTYTENNRDMLDSVVAAKGTTQYLNKQYLYDGVGNVTSITDGINAANNETLSYDGVNRLVEAVGPWGDEKLAYDVNSNLLSKTIGTSVSTFNYDPKTNLLMSVTGTNPENFAYYSGGVTTAGGLSLSYNSLQQMTNAIGTGVTGSAVSNAYSYDGNGNRVIRTQSGVQTFEAYNQKDQLLYQAYPATGNEDMYIQLGGHTVAHLTKTSSTPIAVTYLHNNLLGSAMAATDANSTTKWTQQYEPYGNELTHTSQDNNHLGYTGKPHDNTTDLSYYGARYYSPVLGRFLSPDPAAVDITHPISFNRYAYANDNPYRYVDPDGRFGDDTLLAGLGGALAGGIMGGITYGASGILPGIITGGIAGVAADIVANGLAVAGVASVVAEPVAEVSMSFLGNSSNNKIMTGNFEPFTAIVGSVAGTGANRGLAKAWQKVFGSKLGPHFSGTILTRSVNFGVKTFNNLMSEMMGDKSAEAAAHVAAKIQASSTAGSHTGSSNSGSSNHGHSGGHDGDSEKSL
jgi:RHS repeat-associated protein